MFKTTDSTFRMRITSYHESVSPIWAIIQSLKLNKEKLEKAYSQPRQPNCMPIQIDNPLQGHRSSSRGTSNQSWLIANHRISAVKTAWKLTWTDSGSVSISAKPTKSGWAGRVGRDSEGPSETNSLGFFKGSAFLLRL